jgi:hypothetical protein
MIRPTIDLFHHSLWVQPVGNVLHRILGSASRARGPLEFEKKFLMCFHSATREGSSVWRNSA